MNQNALDLAKYITTKCNLENKPIDSFQLQKILFLIQLNTIITTGTPAFQDTIEAWQIGPVIPNVFYHFCGFGSMPITKTESKIITPINKEEIDRIIESKRKLDYWKLKAETEQPDGPWEYTYKNKGKKEPISLAIMQIKGKNSTIQIKPTKTETTKLTTDNKKFHTFNNIFWGIKPAYLDNVQKETQRITDKYKLNEKDFTNIEKESQTLAKTLINGNKTPFKEYSEIIGYSLIKTLIDTICKKNNLNSNNFNIVTSESSIKVYYLGEEI